LKLQFKQQPKRLTGDPEKYKGTTFYDLLTFSLHRTPSSNTPRTPFAAEMSKLELKRNTTSMSLQDEKALIKQIEKVSRGLTHIALYSFVIVALTLTVRHSFHS